MWAICDNYGVVPAQILRILKEKRLRKHMEQLIADNCWDGFLDWLTK